MLLPAIQYGDWKDVRPRMKSIVRRLKRGEDLIEVMTGDGMLDTESTQGMLILGGTMRPGWINFHCHMPWKALFDDLCKTDTDADEKVEDAVFRASMTSSWGVLGLMSPSNQNWFTGRPAREELFLQAALKSWNEIDAVGARYFMVFKGDRMWNIPNNLQHVLARRGVPVEHLDAPLRNGSPRDLLKYARSVN